MVTSLITIFAIVMSILKLSHVACVVFMKHHLVMLFFKQNFLISLDSVSNLRALVLGHHIKVAISRGDGMIMSSIQFISLYYCPKGGGG